MNKVLKFFNLLDRAGNLSITNIGVYALLLKLLASPGLDWPVVAGLLVTLLNYGHKRSKEQSEPIAVLAPVNADLQQMVEAAQKTANEAKDIAQKLGIANAFQKLK